MERVTGIGGFFFRATDPATLAAWYERHLGVLAVGERSEDGSWWQDEGPTVFASFAADTDHFGSPSQMWMINLRVRDLTLWSRNYARPGSQSRSILSRIQTVASLAPKTRKATLSSFGRLGARTQLVHPVTCRGRSETCLATHIITRRLAADTTRLAAALAA